MPTRPTTSSLSLGDEQYRDARPVIERFLTHADHYLHTAALQVLIGKWHCGDPAYLLVAKRLIAEDPSCRLLAVDYLAWGTLFQKSAASDSLSVLARVARDPHEGSNVRLAAYRGMRTILKGMPVGQLSKLRDVSNLDDIDWTAVDSFLLAE
jgi:hypothetical protein